MARTIDDPVLALPVAVRCRRLRLLLLAVQAGSFGGLAVRTGLTAEQLHALIYVDPLKFTGPVARFLEYDLGLPEGLFDQPPRDVTEVAPLLAIRADNLRALAIESGGAAALARRCGASPQVIQRLLKAPQDSAQGDMPDALLRRLEAGCGRPVGWMDERHPDATAQATEAAALARLAREHERADRRRAEELRQAERLAERMSASLVKATLKAEVARERDWLRSLHARRRALEQRGALTVEAAAEIDYAWKAPLRLSNAAILWHEAGGSWQAVARRCGIPPPVLADMLARGVDADDAASLEQALGKPPGWMHELHEAEFRAAAQALSGRFTPTERAVRRAWLAGQGTPDDETVHPVRRDNLALLVLRHGGTAALARLVDRPAPMVSMWTSRRAGTSGLSAGSARHIEARCGLPVGWMDEPRVAELAREAARVEARRKNLQRLLKARRPGASFHEDTGLDARRVAMLLRAQGGTPITAELARRLEAALGQRPGYLDRDLASARAAPAESLPMASETGARDQAA